MIDQKCPHCDKDLEIPDCVYLNAEAYLPVRLLTVTNCCGRGVYVSPRVVYSVVKAPPDLTKDDWDERLK